MWRSSFPSEFRVNAPYRENIRLATRNEMSSLCDLGRRPGQAEQILSHFRAELADDDDTFQELDAAPNLG